MNYNDFREELLLGLRKHFTAPYSVVTDFVTKNNAQKLEAFRIQLEGSSVAPTIYPQQIYEQNNHQMVPIAPIVQQLKESLCCENTPFPFDFDCISSYEWSKEHIILKVISQSANEDLLKTVPHLPLADLAICFCLFLPGPGNEYGTIQITNEFLKDWNVSVKELYECAQKNTPTLLPPRIHSMEDILSERTGEHIPRLHSMYILTNKSGTLGASCIAYEHLLEAISKQFSSSYYILPSSIHECILIPDSDSNRLTELSDMVKEVNDTVLDPTEILSNHAYFYDKTAGTLIGEC